MPAKLLLRWDIQPEKESEYFEFLVHDFIPALNKLGVGDILVCETLLGQLDHLILINGMDHGPTDPYIVPGFL